MRDLFDTTDSCEASAPDTPSLPDYAARRYLEYAVSVVTGRAVPAISDGQKPVQRRILFSMHKMGLYKSPKHVKSARVVGDVIGKYHPHGDSSVYEAAVRMAQEWSLRYPIVDGQGNFGSLDGDNAAAMRYTEMRLTPIAELLLSEIDEGTVDFVPNYDGVDLEPYCLPARLPFIALNGASGIAVGMATEIPSHNLTEIAGACVALIRSPVLTDAEVMARIPGPDFPGGGQIISSHDDIRAALFSGRGSIRVRARWKVESLARGQWRIAVTELPPGVSVAKIMAEIDARSNPQPKEKNGKKTLSPTESNLKASFMAAIDDSGVRDESDKNHSLRLVIEPRSSRDTPDDLMRLLLAHTSLEINVPVNLTVLGVDRRPKTTSLAAILREWCEFRVSAVTRRTKHRLTAAQKRIHILEGRQAILLDIDKAIRIIRHADDPKADLMAAFGLSEIQADDVLDIRLRQLARLEGIKIGEELAKLREVESGLKHLLSSDEAMRSQVASEIEADAAAYGDVRRTLIEPSEKVTASDAKSVAVVDEPVTVILSKAGWVRSRTGHGIDPAQVNFRSGDALMALLPCRSIEHLVLLDSGGRAYTIPTADIPGGKGDGIPVTSMIEIQGGAKIAFAVTVAPAQGFLVATNGGYGFRCKGEDLLSRGKAGKAFLTVPEGERPVVFMPAPTGEIACLTKDGRALVFGIDEVKFLPKGRGVKFIAADPGKTEMTGIVPVVDGKAGRVIRTERIPVCRGPRGGKGRATK